MIFSNECHFNGRLGKGAASISHNIELIVIGSGERCYVRRSKEFFLSNEKRHSRCFQILF